MKNKQTILVTGGSGFIGSSLVERLIENKNNFVVVVDNLQTGDKNKLPKAPHDNLKFIQCDVNIISEITSVFHTFSFDYVFHYAALVGVKRTLDNPIKVLNDITGIKNILELSKNTGVKRIMYASSSEVYGEPVEYPQHEETTPLNSRLPYAIVKNVGEAFLKSYKQEYGLDYTIFRFFNTYGPKQSKDFVISKFINAALNNKEITIYGEGNQTRTFCFVKNNVEACVAAAFSPEYANKTLNIGNNIETSILDLAKLIIKLTNSQSKLKFLPPLAEGDMTRRHPDITNMKKLLNNKPLISLEDGINIILKDPSFII
ncbi:MAG: NAD-dependent epimerase/dehydratase family protein [Flavobacteriales bacterium]|nr:MAG: NAD-dependent epimerase/dehydratase family protein [Flavobacteriales bacterium]MBE7443161.1 NAD-dependent epimerase/dehydratase family protein [Flavobacteriales bacterium]